MKEQNDFEQMAQNRQETSFLGELWTLIREKKKFWLVPIILVLLLLGVLVLLSGTAVAPFIYTLF
jgi:hypothetical protein